MSGYRSATQGAQWGLAFAKVVVEGLPDWTPRIYGTPQSSSWHYLLRPSQDLTQSAVCRSRLGPKMGRLFLETGMLATGQRFRLGTALTVWPASSPEAGIGSQNTTYTVEPLQYEGTKIRCLFIRHIG